MRELAQFIIDNVGGKDNIYSVSHCATRLRFKLKDNSIANKDKLNANEKVVSVLESGGQLQVVIGSNVASVHAEVEKLLNGGKASNDSIEKEEKTKFNLFTFVSGIFAPILGAFV